MTPFCIIRDGETHGTCRNLSRRASESRETLIREAIDIIVEYPGEGYRYDASENIRVFEGNVSYESTDGRVEVRATQVPLDRGSPGELMRCDSQMAKVRDADILNSIKFVFTVWLRRRGAGYVAFGKLGALIVARGGTMCARR